MSKINIPNITSGFAAVEALNTHLQTIEDELNNKVLYRNNPTGEPNSMQNDLDMNGHSVLNVSTWEADNLSVANLTINGELVVPSDLATSALPDQTSHAFKFLQTDGNTSSWQVPDSSEVTYSSRSVESKLDDFVSVKDYGAVGDGVTDDYATFLACLSAVNAAGGGTVYVPAGTYMLGTPLQMREYNNVHIVGAGMGATVLTRNANFSAASLRFYLGENNSIHNLTLDCDGYDGRGIYLQDIGSWCEHVEVLNCPGRPFGMNGGSNTTWGLDSDGKDDSQVGFTTVSFYPERCSILNCRVRNAGQTALSQKQMHRSKINGNYVELCYSEAVTIDATDYAVVTDNHFVNVSRENSATAFPDKENPGLYLVVGSGGVGGMGIDGSDFAFVSGNTWDGVQENIATINNRSNAAINFVNNITNSFGCKVIGNTINRAKIGVYVKGGTGGDNFKHTISHNVFSNTGTGVGSGSSQYGDIWFDVGQTDHVAYGNRHPHGSLLVTDATNENVWEDEDGFNFIRLTNVGVAGVYKLDWYEEGVVSDATLYGATTAGSLTYGTDGQRIYWTRIGRQVFFNLFVNWTAKDGTQEGQLRLGGLPFVNNSSVNNLPAFSVAPVGFTITGQIHAIVSQGQSYLNLYVTNNGVRTNLDSASLPSSGTLQLSGNYFV